MSEWFLLGLLHAVCTHPQLAVIHEPLPPPLELPGMVWISWSGGAVNGALGGEGCLLVPVSPLGPGSRDSWDDLT